MGGPLSLQAPSRQSIRRESALCVADHPVGTRATPGRFQLCLGIVGPLGLLDTSSWAQGSQLLLGLPCAHPARAAPPWSCHQACTLAPSQRKTLWEAPPSLWTSWALSVEPAGQRVGIGLARPMSQGAGVGAG